MLHMIDYVLWTYSFTKSVHILFTGTIQSNQFVSPSPTHPNFCSDLSVTDNRLWGGGVGGKGERAWAEGGEECKSPGWGKDNNDHMKQIWEGGVGGGGGGGEYGCPC